MRVENFNTKFKFQTIVHEEDTQALAQPIIAPVKKTKFSVVEQNIPETTYDLELVNAS